MDQPAMHNKQQYVKYRRDETKNEGVIYPLQSHHLNPYQMKCWTNYN